MKKILTYMMIAALTLGASSCDSYFDVKLDQNIPTETAYSTVKDVRNGMIGAYYFLGTYEFCGDYVIAIGDMASDLAIASSSTGHFYYINVYGISDTQDEPTQVWSYGYKIYDACVRTIKGAEALEAKATELNLTDEDLSNLSSYKSQCYALRALTTFYMTNLFGLPYQASQTNSQLGIVQFDSPVEPFTNVKRSTVEQCYQQMLSDIVNAKKYYTGDFPGAKTEFYFNEAAIAALEARVNLFMGNYEVAATAAQNAINLRNSGNVSNETYVKMWSSLSITDEDILTITKTENDNLSANSLNTLYQKDSYKGTVSATTTASFAATDIRADVLKYDGYKYVGLDGSAATSNIPIFRKSEMYLIIAEAEAQLGNITASQEALFYTAKRNTAITSTSMLPSTKADLITFIQNERIRELYLEGHRWFDARRWGLPINIRVQKNYDVAKFVYPIPADEINAGFMTEQNEGWENALPE